jgi:hypothetical protein
VQQIVLKSKATLAEAMARLHNQAQRHVVAEAAHQGVSAPVLEPAVLGDYEALAKAAPESIWPKIAQAALGANGNRPADAAQTVEAGQAASIKGAYDLARQGTNVAHGQGRLSAIQALPRPEAVYASELLDGETCDPCAAVDGREYETLDEALGDYPDGGVYFDCDGGDRCRGTLVVVWPSEDNPVADGSTGPEPLPPWQPPPEGMFPRPAPASPPQFVPRPAPVAPAGPVAAQPKPRAYPAWNLRRDLARAENAELRKLSETELEARLTAAYVDETEAGSALVDKLEAEFQRRDDLRVITEAKAAAKEAAKEAKAAAQSAEIGRLITEEQYLPVDAIHVVTGEPLDRVEQRMTLDYLRANAGTKTRRDTFAHATEDEYHHVELHAELERVEAVLRGADLRNPAGIARNVDPMRLFWTKDDAWARRYAGPELKEYWDKHGRLTLQAYRDYIKQAATGRATARDAGMDYLQ